MRGVGLGWLRYGSRTDIPVCHESEAFTIPGRLFLSESERCGSAFRGPRSYFYKGQFTLRANDAGETRKRRDEMMRFLLSQKGEIGEVLLYEAADWLYFVPLSEADPWVSLQ